MPYDGDPEYERLMADYVRAEMAHRALAQESFALADKGWDYMSTTHNPFIMGQKVGYSAGVVNEAREALLRHYPHALDPT